MARELSTTFEDASLEMNTAGDKFRVSLALQGAVTAANDNATAAQAAAAAAQADADTAQATADTALLDAAAAQADIDALIAAGGDIQSVTAGSGLTGGGTSGAVSLAVDFGTGATQVRPGNDAAYTDARAPTNHATNHRPGGPDAIATGTPVSLTPGGANAEGNAINVARANHTHALPAYGTAAGTFMQGNQAAGGDASGTLDALTVNVARGIKTATTTVAVSASTAPTSGQVLIASSTTLAAWGNLFPQGTSSTVGRLIVDAIIETPTSVTYAASVNCDTLIKNDFVIGLLTGNITINLTNPATGRQGFVAVRQDATGGRTVTLAAAGFTNYRDSNTPDLVAASAANAVTIYAYALITVGGLSIALWSKLTPVAA